MWLRVFENVCACRREKESENECCSDALYYVRGREKKTTTIFERENERAREKAREHAH